MLFSRYEFFNELYHRFLLTPKVAMKCVCLQALSIVYGKCCEEIGPFADTKYIVGMLDRVSVLKLQGCVSRITVLTSCFRSCAVYRQAGERPTHPLPQQTHPQQGETRLLMNLRAADHTSRV